jgi:hypothetical protein
VGFEPPVSRPTHPHNVKSLRRARRVHRGLHVLKIAPLEYRCNHNRPTRGV